MTLRAPISIAAVCTLLGLAACSEPAPTLPDTPPGAPATPNDPPVTPPIHNQPSPETPYVGVWAGPQADCAQTPASGERAPIQITRTGFLGYENRCDIRSISRDGNTFDALLDCEAEGVRAAERVQMTVNADTLDLTYVDREGATVSFRRCAY